MFADAGLRRAETLEKVPSSRRALMLSEYARERGVFEALHTRLFDAYWARGRDIGDEQVLVEEGAGVGLAAADVIDALADERYFEQVQAHTRAAFQVGASGVPAWLIDQQLLVPGAQPHEVFDRVMERLGHAPVDSGDEA